MKPYLKSITAWIVFIVLQLFFLPLAVVGLLILIYRQVWVSKRLGVSSPAVDAIAIRWQMHLFGLRDDPATDKLVRRLPTFSPLAMWLMLFPLYAKYCISGRPGGHPVIALPGQETARHVVTNRTVYLDAIIDDSIHEVQQFVVMGAGFDTRCYGPHSRSAARRDLAFFELDRAETQSLKKELLQQSGIDARHVTFVEVDFESDNWSGKLESQGFDRTKKTLFLWEAVTLYLSESAVETTLKEMKSLAVRGSVIAVDIYAPSFVRGDWLGVFKPMLKLLEVTQEELQFALELAKSGEANAKNFVEKQNLRLQELHLLGYATRNGTWMCVAKLTT